MTDYFEMRDAVFRQHMVRVKWHCVPRGFSPITRDVPTYTIVGTMETAEGIYVNQETIMATEWAKAYDQDLWLRVIIADITWRLMQDWYAS